LIANIGGTKALGAEPSSLSCSSTVLNCVVGGAYFDSKNRRQAIVLNEVNGKWRTPTIMPGLGNLKASSALLYSLSCAPKGLCSAVGDYQDRKGATNAFVVSQKTS
jgi:hypothetical protein